MVKRSYICNLCQTPARDEDLDRLLVGFEWKGTNDGDRAVMKSFHSTENHICLRCLSAMSQLAVEVRKTGRAI
jgi:hypothetical protein